MTEQLHFHFSLPCIGGGNGNPLQYSSLENPRDGGAWGAAVYGVAQSWTRLKRFSSSRRLNFAQQWHRLILAPLCSPWGSWMEATCTDKKLMLPAVLWLTGSLSLGQKSPVFCQLETVAVATRLKPQALHSLWQSQFFHYLDVLIVILLHMKITNNKKYLYINSFQG